MFKKIMEQKEELMKKAKDILKDIGVLDTCIYHSDYEYVTRNKGTDEIYALAVAQYKRTETSEDKEKLKVFKDCIKEILDEYPESARECPWCQKIEKE